MKINDLKNGMRITNERKQTLIVIKDHPLIEDGLYYQNGIDLQLSSRLSCFNKDMAIKDDRYSLHRIMFVEDKDGTLLWKREDNERILSILNGLKGIGVKYIKQDKINNRIIAADNCTLDNILVFFDSCGEEYDIIYNLLEDALINSDYSVTEENVFFRVDGLINKYK